MKIGIVSRRQHCASLCLPAPHKITHRIPELQLGHTITQDKVREAALQAATKVTTHLEDQPGGSLPESAMVCALEAARKLVVALEKPQEAIIRFAQSPTTWLAMRTCVQLGVFPMISEKGVSAAEIAKNTGADELWPVWCHAVHQASKSAPDCRDHQIPTGFQNPSDAKHGVLQHTYQTDKEVFPFFLLPGNEEIFDNARPSWVEWFPVEEKSLQGYSTETPLLVDVAGGRGHDITELHRKFPQNTGKLILQGQQPVLNTAAELPACIEKVSIDFFKDVPVDDVGCNLLSAQWDLIIMLVMSGLERTES
ncbi:S-adenosyl-L-methionine-dependent methyltransferase [Apiospora saccharicola]